MKDKGLLCFFKQFIYLENGIITTKNKGLLYALSFILPIFVFSVAYYNAGVFTNHALTVNDLHTQYINFLSYYRNDMLQNGIFYSFAKDFGGNFYGVFTYYLMSPLNLITFLFKPQHLEYAVVVIMMLKTGLSGLFFFFFLSKQSAKQDMVTLAFSLCYSLSSCFVVWHYHILWQDAFYLLPLIMLGVQKTLNGKGSKFFIATFTAALIINYYMAYMIGIFVIVYFVYDLIKAGKSVAILPKFLRMAKAAVISALLSAFITVPTIYSLLQGKADYNDIIGLEVNFIVVKLFDFVPKLLNSGFDGLGSSSKPYVYSSAVVIVFVLMFFFLKNISKREKIATAFVIIFIVVSAMLRPLFLAFHMFSVPNAFPYRFIFLLSFFLVLTAYKAISNFSQINFKIFITVSAVLCVVMLVLVLIHPFDILVLNIIVTFSLFFITALLLVAAKHKKTLLNAIILIVLFDVGLNTVSLIQGNYEWLTYEEKDEFENNYSVINSEIDNVDETGFYRIYNDDTAKNVNNSFKYGFNNYYMSFTSLPESYAYSIMRMYIIPCKNEDLAKAIFGVKYTLQNGKLIEEEEAFPLIFTANNSIYEQKSRNLTQFAHNIYGQGQTDSNWPPDIQLKEIVGIANENVLNLAQNKNRITATVNTEDNNTVALSTIVFDEGWSVKVNGEKVPTTKFLSGLLSFPLQEGENTIVLTYTPKGFIMGAITSLLCLSIIIAFQIYLCIKKGEKKTEQRR